MPSQFDLVLQEAATQESCLADLFLRGHLAPDEYKKAVNNIDEKLEAYGPIVTNEWRWIKCELRCAV